MGVYVHFPWCLEKCPYCDFLSVKVPGAAGDPVRARELIPHDAYADAILREIETRLSHLETGSWSVETVFFGGGTPSLWSPAAVGRVLADLKRALPWAEDVEVTLECNPTSVSTEHFEQLLSAGVNRVSLGVQATENQRLDFLGRLHDENGGLRAIAEALRAGVPRVSADLIFGVHSQSPEAARRDVQRVADTGITHLSCYALTIEPNTRFGALHRQGRLPLLEDDLIARSFEVVSEELRSRGYEHYEISNFALPGEESRHNLGYWRARDYLGLGTGAYGTLTFPEGRLRYRNFLSPERYLNAFGTQPLALDPFRSLVSEREDLTAETSATEAILLGLRLALGIAPAEIEQAFGVSFWTKERTRQVEKQLAKGNLVQAGDRLCIPLERWLFADAIIRDLL